MKKRTYTTRGLALLLSLLLVIGAFTGCGDDTSKDASKASGGSSQAVSSAAQTSSGEEQSSGTSVTAKTITVKVVHKDGSEKELSVETDADNLRGALEPDGIIAGEESEYGLFVKTVDGETADDANQEWWCVTKGGEMLNTGVDDTKIADGETYEFTLTVGY